MVDNGSAAANDDDAGDGAIGVSSVNRVTLADAWEANAAAAVVLAEVAVALVAVVASRSDICLGALAAGAADEKEDDAEVDDDEEEEEENADGGVNDAGSA